MTTLGGGVVYVDHGVNQQPFGDITKTFHTQTFIAGFSYSHYQKQENNSGGGNQGSFGFINDSAYSGVVNQPQDSGNGVNEAQAFANFLTGNANNGFSQASKNVQVNVQSNLYEAFLQDNWKARPRLTLNFGVRYSYFGQPWDANGNLSNFDPAKYSASGAPTIASTGLICFTAPCSQSGSNVGLPTTPNGAADLRRPELYQWHDLRESQAPPIITRRRLMATRSVRRKSITSLRAWALLMISSATVGQRSAEVMDGPTIRPRSVITRPRSSTILPLSHLIRKPMRCWTIRRAARRRRRRLRPRAVCRVCRSTIRRRMFSNTRWTFNNRSHRR